MSCWPPTPAGKFAETKCPGYVPFLNSSGTWEYQPKNVTEFCDLYGVCHFDDCLKRHKKSKQPQKRTFQTALKLLRYCTTCCYICSVVATAMAISAFIYIRCNSQLMRCTHNYIHLNLFVAFFIRGILTLTVSLLAADSKSDWISIKKLFNAYGCKAAATLWTYFYVASYFWMFVEGLYLHNLIYIHAFWEPYFLTYFLLGWGLPLMVIALWMAVKSLLDNFGCWIIYHNTQYMWVVTGPIGVLLIVHFGIFVNVIRALLTRRNSANVSAAGKYRKLLKSTVIMLFVFGVDYFFLLLPTILMKDDYLTLTTVIFLYVETVPNSLQSFIVAFTYGLYNPEVRLVLWRHWNGFQLQWHHGHSNDRRAELKRSLAKLLNGTARKLPQNVLPEQQDLELSPMGCNRNAALSTIYSSATSTVSRRQRNPPSEANTSINVTVHPNTHFEAELSAAGMAWPDGLNGSLLGHEDTDKDEMGQDEKADEVTHL